MLNSASCSAFATCLQRGYDLGLHLNLTAGRSITSGSSISDTSGVFLGKVGLRESIKRHAVSEEDVAAEIQAQMRCEWPFTPKCLINPIVYQVVLRSQPRKTSCVGQRPQSCARLSCYRRSLCPGNAKIRGQRHTHVHSRQPASISAHGKLRTNSLSHSSCIRSYRRPALFRRTRPCLATCIHWIQSLRLLRRACRGWRGKRRICSVSGCGADVPRRAQRSTWHRIRAR